MSKPHPRQPEAAERFVNAAPDVWLWVEESGERDATPLLLIMGAASAGVIWPGPFVSTLAAHHRVIRYDHRDTGRSTWAFDGYPYAVADLAADAIVVLDALGIERAHVVGMSMGGTLVQLLLLDNPDRLLSATIFCTSALETSASDAQTEGAIDDLPGPDPRLLAVWEQIADARDYEAELAWRVEHWRLLNGDAVPFDAAEFRHLEEQAIEHAGRHETSTAHARADQSGLDRGVELGRVNTPTLVIEAPQDPAFPPPHAGRLAEAIPSAELVTVPGMGHALSTDVLAPVAEAILAHTAMAERSQPPG
jgi:pimeloyl-ACP methyl ester carboxylesterase